MDACFASIVKSVILFWTIQRLNAATTQETLDYIGINLHIKYEVISNIWDEANRFSGQLTLTNSGDTAIESGLWEIRFCHIRMFDQQPDINGTELGTSGLKVYHINGCQFKIAPTDDFQNLAGKAKLVVPFKSQLWQVAKTDVMPNWYVTAANLTPRTIQSTAGESLSFVGNFDTLDKWKRYWFDELRDQYDPYTLEVRYDKNNIDNFQSAARKPIIPTPIELSVTGDQKIFIGTGDWVIIADDNLMEEANILGEILNMPIINGSSPKPLSRYIRLKNGTVVINGELQASDEAYGVTSQSEQQTVTITAPGKAGAFYAAQSMISSIMEDDSSLPVMSLKDAPRYSFRGMHLDVSRNFIPKEYVLKLLQVMSMYKLNKFHFHLTDDEGWRLEIPGLEELTQIGAKRCHDVEEKTCSIPQLGSGPTSQTSGSGYYTVDEYKEILSYAKKRHIEVIPEFDMPGHAHAAIKAMEAKGDPDFLLSDPKDDSKYLSVQMFTDNAMNPCINSTYKFVDHVVREVVAMHQDISPLRVFHFGGDEVAEKAWEGSPACHEIKEFNDTRAKEWVEELKEMFVQKVANITATYGLDMGGWEDGFLGSSGVPYKRNELKNANILANAWQNIWDWGVANRSYVLANAGYKVVMSQATHLYFDHPYEPDPEERGYYWATRFTGTKKTFGFMPDSLYRNADFKSNGDPLTEEELCADGQCVPLNKTENIIGMQGHLWSETVRTGEQMETMVFPRLLALAERAWHKASWESQTDKDVRERIMSGDWNEFANSLGYKELLRLDKLGVAYHVPLPGAKYIVEESKLAVNVALPGLKIEYRTAGSGPWEEIDGKASISSGNYDVRTKSADGSRSSRMVQISIRPIASSTTAALLQPFLLAMSCLLTIILSYIF